MEQLFSLNSESSSDYIRYGAYGHMNGVRMRNLLHYVPQKRECQPGPF